MSVWDSETLVYCKVLAWHWPVRTEGSHEKNIQSAKETHRNDK